MPETTNNTDEHEYRYTLAYGMLVLITRTLLDSHSHLVYIMSILSILQGVTPSMYTRYVVVHPRL